MTDHSFAAVLEAAQSGDEDAFRSLFRAVQPGLLRYLTLVAGATAEDVAAETWVSVVRNLGRFTGTESGFGAWVFTIARARLRDDQRRIYRGPTLVHVDEPLADVVEGPDPADHVVESEGTMSALTLIAALPTDQAEVVLLRHVVGFDVAQTAEILGKRPGAVRTASSRGLNRLRSALSGESESVTGPAVTNLRLRAIDGVT